MTSTQATQPMQTIRVRWAPAWRVVLALWIVLLFLSLYQAHAIRDVIDRSDVLRRQTWLRDAVTEVMRFGDTIGMDALRRPLSTVREALNDSYTVLETPASDRPTAGQETAAKPEKPTALAHFSPRRPRRILVIGASSIQFAVGVDLEKRLPRDYEDVKVKRFGQLATGLSRPDFMNWPDKLRSLAKSFKPDLVICNFGGNDAQAIPIDEYNSIPYPSAEWDAKYGERITEMIEVAKAYGADTVMIGMPIMRSPKFSRKMRRLNRVMKKATEDAGMLFVSTYEKASLDGKYRTEVQVGRKRGLMRTSDGVHYTRLGARFVMNHVMEEIERRYHLVPTNDALGAAQRHGFASKTAAAPVWYTAYLPRALTVPRPAVVILPDDQDQWARWPQFPHRRLQRWADERQVVLVVPEAAHDTAYVGKLASVLREELPQDLKRNLPVDAVAYAGSGRGGLSALAVGDGSPGLLLYRPWVDLSKHKDDPALIATLGDPAANPRRWRRRRWVQGSGSPVWLQAGPSADPLRKSLGGRLLDAGPPAKSFLTALDAGLRVLVPPPEPEPEPQAEGTPGR